MKIFIIYKWEIDPNVYNAGGKFAYALNWTFSDKKILVEDDSCQRGEVKNLILSL
jgi:hypothetical protein